MTIKARVNVIAASTSLAYNWLLGRAMVLGSFITVSGRLIVLGYTRTGTYLLCLQFFSQLSCLPLHFSFLRGHGFI